MTKIREQRSSMVKLILSIILAVLLTACHGVRITPTSSTARTSLPPLTTPREWTTTTVPEEPPLPPVCEDSISTTNPLARLRAAMRNPIYTHMKPLNAYIIFYTDEHLSEEPSAEERRLEYVSGWDGVGTAAIIADAGAAVWVAGADVKRAIASLSCAWQVFDADDPNQQTIAEWITERLKRGDRVGADSRLTSHTEWTSLSTGLQQQGLNLTDVSTLVDKLWAEELDPAKRRPEFSKIVAKLHHMDYVGMSWRDKVSAVRDELHAVGADAMVVTALDEVAWLLNVRGRDLPYAPLLKAFVIVSKREIRVYAPPGKLSMPVREALAVYNCYSNNCTRVNDYANIYSDLRRATESKILIPASGTFQRGASAAIAQSVPLNKQMFLLSPIIYLKAQKNEAEVKGMKKAHLRDAVAMCTLLCYLQNKNKVNLSEISVAESVELTRGTQAGFVGASMRTRVAFGPSGYEPEYIATPRNNRRVFTNSTLIIRSGGQYLEGTTVVTRTVHYGVPSREMKRAYTTVLRAVAALASLQAPVSLPAAHLDPVARAPLWLAKQDYVHPTGHGVGAALNRREDPVVIDYRQDINLHTLREGYFITSEPGWYEAKFGVSLGNVLEVIPKSMMYIGFREATLIPYEPKLIDKNLLTDYEINWLNVYNERIRATVGPELEAQGLTDVLYWMRNKTIPIKLPSKVQGQVSAATKTAAELSTFLFFVTLIRQLY
ncbi:unnamed protein product [Diatraea saccharalis]|uniref:Xaa-Pro aminopeptidase 1 n=1 Tax=Diatraea saccharalis TaxID=40085 RepID=A0A9P0G2X4_9NEOP|nr:unnamed protein product [Diatraea saccharalis]